jgi:hypothetical protein
MDFPKWGRMIEMPKLIVGLLSGIVLLLAVPGMAQAQHAGARMHLGQPDYERTVTGSEQAVLAHTKSTNKHTVCASRHNTDHAIIHYDGNELTLDPGHCVLVEASYITAQSSEGVRAAVFGWHHNPAHQHNK